SVCTRSRAAMRGRSTCPQWWPGTLPIPVRTPCRRQSRRSAPGTRAAAASSLRNRSRAACRPRASRARRSPRTASTGSILRWSLQSRAGLESSEPAPRLIPARLHSRIATQSDVSFQSLGLIGRLVLEQRTGSKVAVHLAVFRVEPIDDLVLGKLDDLSVFY